ncbi:MAG: hypothetical protein AUG89_00060 [Acidobacteria bacterium 13_1_20CM_4_56_7]|nr:MAG: hypothetical protein AUG89_00060 [Acidobacteria bacterium 13_1_20CM_4_56_7]
MNQVRRILVALLLPSLSTATCIPFDQARNHLDETRCVTGKVIRVQEGDEGIRYLDFCEDYRLCTFTVVVFPHDLKKIGDVRQLAGRVVEISGEIKEYDDRAEIVLESSKQLNSRLMRLSPLPKSFDVEERGHFSPGNPRRPRASHARKKKGVPTLPANLPDDAESD